MPTTRRRLVRAATTIAAAVGVLLSVGLAVTPAVAASTPIDPATAKESILVIARDNSTPPAKPLPGIPVQVTGDGFDVTLATGDDGRVEVGLPGPGTFEVTLDVSKVPAGLALPSALKPSRSVEVDTGNKQVLANYIFISATAAQTQQTASPSPGATATHPKASSSSASVDFGRRIWPALATGLIFGLLLALASIGVSLIYGTTGLNNFAHGELVTFGGLMAYTFTSLAHLPGWLGIIIATVLGGAFGFAQDLGLWRPLRRKRVALIPLMIVSIGLSLAVRYLYQIIFGPGTLLLPQDSSAALTLGPVRLTSANLAAAVIAIVVLVGVAWLLTNTRIGKATRAVSDNRSLAAASGIDVESVIRIVWTAGGALAGLAGALLAYYQTVQWDSGAQILLAIFAAVTLGGLGTAYGALVGSLIIGLFINVSAIWLPANLKFVAALIAMIVILLVRPQGILGKKDRIG
ncbi:branched-chain amino acid ABC transporter permease [Gryllotalpicola protaetiae]|uniref:Branched-chain amino acid ABC transporter permease n=1 Tax=Gryllotalpicola protaetiae TaxID=2419771 RepID=A0A387BPQ5_9MICO|nr:branched-chain amino acid ABC transporter permease [Gryllotalpicola protaetiae]AYG02936.1 branched-chain amino acid ABC transporter permease [Gryllotalpicola protaetiae]